MQIEWRTTKTLKPYAKNAKKHGEKQVENIANSLQRFGWQQPIVIDKNNVVVMGHGRLLAAKRLGMKSVPVTVADDLTDDEIRELRIIDNKVAESEWDFDLLKADIPGLTFSGFDFDFGVELADTMIGTEDSTPLPDWAMEDAETYAELAKYDTPEDGEDDYEEDIPEPVAKSGQIYRLGIHRLMCGDSTSRADVAKLLDGNECELLLTDPPYGVNIVSHTDTGKGSVGGSKAFGSTKGKVKNGNELPNIEVKKYIPIKGDDTTETARKAYELAKEFCKKQILFGGNYFADFLPPSRCWIVWDKGVPPEAFFAPVELAWCSRDANCKLYKFLWSGVCREGDRETEGVSRVHPTQKPVGLMQRIIDDFTEEGDSVCDLFGGSGSTLIACEKSNRSCFMMEYEPHYVDVIINRWETITGETAELIAE